MIRFEMTKKTPLFIPFFCLCLFYLAPFSFLSSHEPEEQLLQEIPVAYKGRFRPLDAMARLWLEDFYHRQSLKPSQYNDFHVPGSSALSLLWKIQFSNYRNWDDAPLFWVYSAAVKELLDLPVKENYFSYHELFQTLYETPKTNLALIKELITYHFLKAYYDSANRSGSDQIELQQLAAGLWVAIKNNQLTLVEVTKTAPWHHLEKGFIIAENADQLTPDYVKQHRAVNEEIFSLLNLMNQFTQLTGPYPAGVKEYEAVYEELIKRKTSPMQIAEFLDQEFPLSQRLGNAGTLFKVLPSKNGEWYSLNALALKTYNQEENSLRAIPNFTLYSDDQFTKIQNTYFKLIFDYEDVENKTQLANLLIDNYHTIAGTPIQKAWEKSLTYPSLEKLKMEYWYYQLPWIETTMAVYGLAIIFLIIGWNQKYRKFTQIGIFLTLVAFALNTLILLIRCFILQRPPVSSMFETVLYVPWIAVLVSLILAKKTKNSLILLGSCLVALILLVVLKATGLDSSLENVQAVLDSQFWLIIHVLMIVASYGVFALAGILGQIYLFQYIIHEHETFDMQELGKAILQALYVGVCLLIPGTILGGIWAAQSWGRFWDWDPKESWAFISSCIYLIFIHAYTFKYIRYFGLAMGAVIGLLAISFTWYGVNYILATGLHTYGFGSGGEIYYYLFLLAEILFLIFVGIFHLRLTKVNNSR